MTKNSDWYQKVYARSIAEPAQFWAEQANHYLNWFKPWRQVMRAIFGIRRYAGL